MFSTCSRMVGLNKLCNPAQRCGQTSPFSKASTALWKAEVTPPPSCWFDHLPQISMRVQWQVLDLRTNIMSLFSSPFANIFVGKKKSSWKYACFKLFAWLPVPCSFVRKVRQFRNAVETGQLPLHACLANKWPTWMEFVQDFEIAFYLFKVAFLVFNLSLLTFC